MALDLSKIGEFAETVDRFSPELDFHSNEEALQTFLGEQGKKDDDIALALENLKGSQKRSLFDRLRQAATGIAAVVDLSSGDKKRRAGVAPKLQAIQGERRARRTERRTQAEREFVASKTMAELAGGASKRKFEAVSRETQLHNDRVLKVQQILHNKGVFELKKAATDAQIRASDDTIETNKLKRQGIKNQQDEAQEAIDLRKALAGIVGAVGYSFDEQPPDVQYAIEEAYGKDSDVTFSVRKKTQELYGEIFEATADAVNKIPFAKILENEDGDFQKATAKWHGLFKSKLAEMAAIKTGAADQRVQTPINAAIQAQQDEIAAAAFEAQLDAEGIEPTQEAEGRETLGGHLFRAFLRAGGSPAKLSPSAPRTQVPAGRPTFPAQTRPTEEEDLAAALDFFSQGNR